MRTPRLLGVLVLLAGMMMSLIGGTVQAQERGTVEPAVGGPGTTFTFHASGFKGDLDGKNGSSAEMVAFWVNLPDGSIVDQYPKEGNEKSQDRRFLIRANDDGSVQATWVAPADVPVGSYSLIFAGTQSNVQRVLPFTVDAQAPAVPITGAPAAVEPSVGRPGNTFTFTADGFKGDPPHNGDHSNDAEQVAFWINTPDGRVISQYPKRDSSNDDEDTRFLAKANRAGRVVVEWAAPADAEPGSYSLVFHGVDSEREQVIVFRIE